MTHKKMQVRLFILALSLNNFLLASSSGPQKPTDQSQPAASPGPAASVIPSAPATPPAPPTQTTTTTTSSNNVTDTNITENITNNNVVNNNYITIVQLPSGAQVPVPSLQLTTAPAPAPEPAAAPIGGTISPAASPDLSAPTVMGPRGEPARQALPQAKAGVQTRTTKSTAKKAPAKSKTISKKPSAKKTSISATNMDSSSLHVSVLLNIDATPALKAVHPQLVNKLSQVYGTDPQKFMEHHQAIVDRGYGEQVTFNVSNIQPTPIAANQAYTFPIPAVGGQGRLFTISAPNAPVFQGKNIANPTIEILFLTFDLQNNFLNNNKEQMANPGIAKIVKTTHDIHTKAQTLIWVGYRRTGEKAFTTAAKTLSMLTPTEIFNPNSQEHKADPITLVTDDKGDGKISVVLKSVLGEKGNEHQNAEIVYDLGQPLPTA